MAVSELVDKKDNFIDNAEENLTSDFNSIEQSIYSATLSQINKMNQSDGKILFDEENLLKLAALSTIIIDAIQASSYPSRVKEYIGGYDKVANYNFKIQNQVNDIPVNELEDLIFPVKDQIISQVLDGLVGQGVSTQFIKPLTETIYKNIVAGASIDELKKNLEAIILSNEQRLGLFKRYVSQISRDSIMQYEGQINSRIADFYGLDAYQYVGSLIRDSRPQCVRWVGMGILLKKNLSKELQYAANAGSGLIPGTTPDNFVIYRGGYNCRHTAIPIKLTKEKKKEFGL
jgi:hypothetical protein